MLEHIPTYDLYGETSDEKPDFWLHCETIASRSSLHRWEIALHRHESFLQILYIQGGAGEALFGGRVHAIHPPAVIIIPPRVDHGFRFSRDIAGLVITVVATHLRIQPGGGSSLGEWLSVPRLTLLDRDDDDAAYLGRTLERIGEECASRHSGGNELIDACLTSTLVLTARLSNRGKDVFLPDAGTNERRVERLLYLIHQHFRAHQPASFYAGQLGLSPTHLNRIVREVTGCSTHELIARKLIEEAKRALVFTTATVQEIGFGLGFADPAYFSRFFLQRTGITPRAYRNAETAKLVR